MADATASQYLNYTSDGMGFKIGDDGSLQGSFQTFAGVDMTVFFGPREVGTLMSLTVSIVREVVPIYTTASANPRAFAKGKRAISGSLVFAQFDRHALLEGVFADVGNVNIRDKFIEGSGEISSEMSGLASLVQSDPRMESYKRNYSDQLPPFDIVVTMLNENGAASVFAVRDVVIVNEGMGFTVDDLTGEMACSYVAKNVVRVTPFSRGQKESSFNSPELGDLTISNRGWA